MRSSLICSTVLSCVAFIGFGASQVALAADVAAPVYKAPPPMATPVFNWTGFYIGINGGYGWGREQFDPPLNFFQTLPGFSDVRSRGWLFGAHAGYNWQYDSWVAGFEADIDGAKIRAAETQMFRSIAGIQTVTQSLSTKFDALGTARARLGFLATPDLLLYGTGGLAWGHTKQDALSRVVVPIVNFVESAALSGAQSHFGWSAGAGAERKMTSLGWSNLILRIEYLHYGFGDQTTTLAGMITTNGVSSPISAVTNQRLSVDVVRAGLTWQFAPGPAAKY
jgi:outer membrane immunogenic protein